MISSIRLQHVSKSFTERNWRTLLGRKPRTIPALEDVSLSINRGEIMGLLGPNGAGKTTLIKILATLITPDKGGVTIGGHDTTTDSPLIRKNIGLVNTNNRTFYWRLTGRDNLRFFASLYDLTGKKKKERVEEVLAMTGMTGKADFRFMSYSAGQKQRLSIARAMLSDPEILLLDEATASLDPIGAHSILDLTKNILSAKKQKTILWCTHNLNEADAICDRLTILHRGKILWNGTPAEIKQLLQPVQRYRLTVDRMHTLLTDTQKCQADFDEGREAFSCTVRMERDQIAELLARLTKSGIRVFECNRVTPPLEEVFTELIARERGAHEL